jgi:xylulokinase
MQSGPVVLGIDIGTYEAKGVLVGPDGIVFAQHRRPHTVLTPAPGFVEHDPETTWWAGFVDITRALLASAGRDASVIVAIAVSGIGPCVLPVDDQGDPLRNAILYSVDSRAQAQIQQLNHIYGAAEILARAGTALSPQSAGPKILWIEQNEPDVFARTTRFVTCQTFLAGRLTGRWRIDHATGAYFHPFYDRRTQTWNLDGAPGSLRAEQLPELGWSSEVAGHVTAGAAAITGLTQGTPVLVGAPDAAVEALSAGVGEPGDMMIMYGSSHFIIEVIDKPHSSQTLWPAPFLFPDSHLAAASLSTAGSFTRWFANLLSPTTGGSDELYTQIADAAALSPPGARGLLALPYLGGDPYARGGFAGLTMQHNRGDMARAVAESIAQGVAKVLRGFDADGLTPTLVRAVGGGTKNAVWLQAVTDISGLTQHVAAGPGASYGNALLAGLTAGFLDTPRDIRRWVTTTKTLTPRPEFAALYLRQREAFDHFYACARKLDPLLDDLNPASGQEIS